MDTTVSIRDSIVQTIGQKTPVALDATVPDIRDAVAFLLDRVGNALAVQRPTAGAVLDNLLLLDTLTHGRAQVAAIWLGLRALSVKSGDVIAAPQALLQNPVFTTLLKASGLNATFAQTDVVQGVFSTVWLFDNASKGARRVSFEQGTLDLEDATGRLARVDIQNDPRGALATIDALTISLAQKNSKNTPAPLAYEVLDDASLSVFATEIFSTYTTRRISIPNAIAHPTDLVESAALASVLPPVPTYKPFISPALVEKGVLSDVQLETIIYAGEAHSHFLPTHPNDPNLDAPRQGFLIGHGTGFGKGRVAAGIIADNWAQGRKRHVWVSESSTLINAAREDWVAMGGAASDVWSALDMPATQSLPQSDGILFITYAGLRSTNGMGRIRQITEWMSNDDGVIAFDESQNLRNSVNSKSDNDWDSDASKQAQAAIAIQDKMPRARVVYMSATSASDIIGLAYAYRLGLWGEGTAFPDSKAFFEAMKEGGTNALEMVARDMKAMGLYLAANMSFEGVEMERLEHKMTPFERDLHDKMSALWLEIGVQMRTAVASTGIQSGPAGAISRQHRRPNTHFGTSRARFFQATITSMKMPLVIESIKADLKNGHVALVQLANTFEANADRAIAAAQEAGLEMDGVCVTPRDIIINYLMSGFPIHQWERVKNSNNAISIVPKLDQNGDQMICPKAWKQREDLLARVEQLSLPEGPLEQLFDAFGTETMAEATGRSRRLVPNAQGTRVLEERCQKDMIADIKAFHDKKKLVLAFSPAGATGQTYSAKPNSHNTALRRHYLVQAGWRADLAIQGMGRSHRSNQVQAPEYILVTIDLWADQRMISRVARGMNNLGAITRGQRQAASQDFFTQDENLEDCYAQQAWHGFVKKLFEGSIPTLSLGQFEYESGITIRTPDLALPPAYALPPVQRFLNAMAAMSCQSQAVFGHVMREEIIRLRTEAIANGNYDRGIETIRPDALIKLESLTIHRDPRSGSETKLLKMLRVDKIEPQAFKDARMSAFMSGNASVVKSLTTNRVAVLCFPRLQAGVASKSTDKVGVYTPTGARQRTRAEVVAEGWQRIDNVEAEALWNAEGKERGLESEKSFWVVSGTLLPVWDKLPGGNAVVYRMETDEGEQIVGRIVPDYYVDDLVARMEALSTGGITADKVVETITCDGVVELVNGWVLQGRSVSKVFQGAILYLPTNEEPAMRTLRAKGFQATAIRGRDEIAYRIGADDLQMGIEALVAAHPAARLMSF